MKKGLNIEVTTGQYQLLYNLICDAYDRGYDQRPSIAVSYTHLTLPTKA